MFPAYLGQAASHSVLLPASGLLEIPTGFGELPCGYPSQRNHKFISFVKMSIPLRDFYGSRHYSSPTC